MSRQAIVIKVLPPTNTRDARVKATAAAGSVTIPWSDGADYTRDAQANHFRAAAKLASKFGWNGSLVEGGLPNGDRVFVFKD